MNQLNEIIYVSQRRLGLTESQIVDDIVLPSSRTNRNLDITGCLWFNNSKFLQVLEGPKEAVEMIYAKIEADDRHHDVKLICNAPLAERSFSRWGMRSLQSDCNSELDQLAAQYMQSHGIVIETQPQSSRSSRIRALFDRVIRHD